MMTIIFDLDGTLVDSAAIVFPLFREVIRHFPNHPQPDDETLRKTFGNPDTVIWEMLLPSASQEEREEAFALYEEIVQKRFGSHDILIPGVREVLDELFAQGHTLTIASNCGLDYLNSVLDTFDLRRYVTAPLCLESVAGTKKADILRQHFTRFAKQNAVMVGDRHTDIEAADEFGIPTIGCRFGFGTQEELAGAASVIRHPSELLEAVARLQQ
ncbi:HAD family hydrolase [Alicyclobacillus sp. SO9]|uniref:HAD family hydrolase n=1 Tax=Alicyclobacillus sp. SO9 TaxID=2665646 RepID=UPI0018E78883|nr:HAD family hydrolase [Alicyclobacillus sp. SO9]QQE80221.1 HAD family hydrolase [Alicyclobacillus sp. SO9]